jgi:hypothetical protein
LPAQYALPIGFGNGEPCKSPMSGLRFTIDS